MRKKAVPAILFTLFLMAACQPAGRLPVFSIGVDPAATSMPLPAKGPGVTLRLSERIESFDVSPDLNLIALGTSGGVMLYDYNTQKRVRTLNDGEFVSSVAWSPDGSKLAVGNSTDRGWASDEPNKPHLTVWDTFTWKTVFAPDFGQEMVNDTFRDLAWSPDNRSLAFSNDTGSVQVYDTRTGQVISRQTNFAGTVVDISWSPDGSRLVATNDMAYGIRRWRVSDDQAVRLFDPRASSSMQVAWSPDGKRIASGHMLGTVCLWTAATNRCDGFIQAHREATYSLAWSPDGNELATGGGVIRIWDTRTGRLIKAFGEENGIVYNQIEWPALDKPLMTLAGGSENIGDTVLRLWDVTSGSILMEFRGKQQGE